MNFMCSDPVDVLRRRLHTDAFEQRDVVLSSGKSSNVFFDCKKVVLTAVGHMLAGLVLFPAVMDFRRSHHGFIRAVAGTELGGCPLASAVAMVSADRGDYLDALYVRKEPKIHGSRNQVEGGSHFPICTSVVVLEDVTTTGGSALRAVRALQEARFLVAGVVTLIDRLEGAEETLKAAGIPLKAIYTRDDFLPK